MNKNRRRTNALQALVFKSNKIIEDACGGSSPHPQTTPPSNLRILCDHLHPSQDSAGRGQGENNYNDFRCEFFVLNTTHAATIEVHEQFTKPHTKRPRNQKPKTKKQTTKKPFFIEDACGGSSPHPQTTPPSNLLVLRDHLYLPEARQVDVKARIIATFAVDSLC